MRQLSIANIHSEVESMAKWTFEPGHTAAEFRARHMMVSYVRGHFKNVHGRLVFDPASPQDSEVEATIDARGIWTGEPNRDAHLRSADFLDVDNYTEITFRGNQVEVLGDHDYNVSGELTIRGVTRPATLRVRYLGQWQTPWWEDGVDKGPRVRAGFVAETAINRHDFGVSWNDTMDRGGIVVGNTVHITIDVEAVQDA
jgi:polyisoprenoid-binding protein YceI